MSRIAADPAPDRAAPAGSDAAVLVVTAVAAERDAVLRGLDAAGEDADGWAVQDVGFGPAGAAAGTATALARAARSPRLVVCAGIGGGYAPAADPGDLVLADAMIAADLGADSPDGFLPVEELGFGTSRHLPPPVLLEAADRGLTAARLPLRTGSVLTVSTATGTAEGAAELLRRHPGAAAEAMEGFGAAEAAARHGLPVLEVRAVSNRAGPRDRDAWRIGDALAVLERAFAVLPEALRGIPADAGRETPATTGTGPGDAPPSTPPTSPTTDRQDP